MRKIKTPSNKQILAICVLMFIALNTANAQKQPQIQEISMRAPDNVKIDGKLNEWPNKFLNAYNSTNRIYYVISNDDSNLYLTVRGLGNGVAKKMLAGGMTLTISHATRKQNLAKAGENVAVTFPVPQDAKITADIMGTINQLFNYLDDSVANRGQIDPIISKANRLINNAMKEIGVVGIKAIPDSVISIYNTEGIKAAAQFIQVQPVIELAIPLKYLGLSIDDQAKFSYNIKLSEIPVQSMSVNPNTISSVNPSPNNGYAFNATDFWGEYTLAKKP